MERGENRRATVSLMRHFGLATEAGHALTESAAFGSNGLADSIFGVENRAVRSGGGR